LSVADKRVLRGILELKSEELTAGEHLTVRCFVACTCQINWGGVACMGERRYLCRGLLRKKKIGSPRLGWQYNIKVDL